MFNLRESFYLLIRENVEFYRFMKEVEENYYVYLMGGAVRKYIENEHRYDRFDLPRDFDFVVEYRRGNTLENILGRNNIIYSINRFSGYKLNFGKYKVDIWKLEDTWAFKKSSMPAKFTNLEKSVFLNVDGIVYDFYRDRYYKKNYDEAERNKKICIVFKQKPYVNINAIRAKSYAKRYNMKYSNQVKKMIVECASCDVSASRRDIMAGGDFANYGKRFNDLEMRYNQLPIVPIAVQPAEVVSDSDRRKDHQASKQLHHDAIAAYDEFIRDATSLKNDIRSHLDELQSNEKGGHLENWIEKCSKIDAWIDECKRRRENDERYL